MDTRLEQSGLSSEGLFAATAFILIDRNTLSFTDCDSVDHSVSCLMDSDGFGEMLFGFQSSQDSMGDVWDYESQDEEMLDAPFDDELTSWNLLDSPMLLAPCTNQDSNELSVNNKNHVRDNARQFHRPEISSHIAKARYGGSHSVSSYCLTCTGIG